MTAHPDSAPDGVRFTPDVAARLAAIAVPFVRRVTRSRVVAAARAHGVSVVDVAFFDRASTY